MATLTPQQLQQLQKKVPKAIFLDNVQQVCKKQGTQNLLALLDQQYNKYRLVQGQLLRSSQSMHMKIPQIQKTIQMIQALRINPKTQVDFMLSQGIYVKAKPKENIDKISLWLGANTIVQLSFQEATIMLNDNLKNAVSSLKQINQQLAYIKDQKTTTEVNVARVYNHSLLEKRQQQLKEDKEQSA